MKISLRTLTSTLGMLVPALLFIPNCSAQCGGLRQPVAAHSSWRAIPGQAQMLRAAFTDGKDRDQDDEEEGIVGFWHVKFVSQGSTGIPDGTEVDAGYAQWHSDGTEVMNSGGRSPITGSFCLGVWKKVGPHKYKLNHFAAAWDATGSQLVGPGNIREEVTVARDGKQFSGTFTIDQYDESGNTLAHVKGTITGTRIGIETPAQSVF